MQWNATSRDMSSPGLMLSKRLMTVRITYCWNVRYVPHKTAGAFDGFFCFFSWVRFFKKRDCKRNEKVWTTRASMSVGI